MSTSKKDSKPKKAIKKNTNSQIESKPIVSKEIVKVNKPEKGIKLHLFTKKQILLLIKKNKFHNACHVANFFSYLNMD